MIREEVIRKKKVDDLARDEIGRVRARSRVLSPVPPPLFLTSSTAVLR